MKVRLSKIIKNKHNILIEGDLASPVKVGERLYISSRKNSNTTMFVTLELIKVDSINDKELMIRTVDSKYVLEYL